MIEEAEHKSVRRNLSSTLELDAENLGTLLNVIRKYSPEAKNEDTLSIALMTKEKKFTAKIGDINDLSFEFYKKIESFSIKKGVSTYGNPFHLDFSYSKSILGNITLSIESDNATSFSNEVENFLRHNKCWYDFLYTKTIFSFVLFTTLLVCLLIYEMKLYISKMPFLKTLWNDYTIIFLYAIIAFSGFLFFLIRRLFPMYQFKFGNEKKRLEKLKNVRRIIIGIPAAITTFITFWQYLPKV